MTTLKRFQRMMRRLKPYLPKPQSLPQEKEGVWRAEDPRVTEYPLKRRF